VLPWRAPSNPVTKTNGEGVGVTPDVSVPASAALEEAHRRALQEITRRKQTSAKPCPAGVEVGGFRDNSEPDVAPEVTTFKHPCADLVSHRQFSDVLKRR